MTEYKNGRIVCAANKYANGAIVCGARHFDTSMRSVLALRPSHYNSTTCEQGFIDTFGNFVTRLDAWMLASRYNQIYRLVGSQREEDIGVYGTKLYSENLY